LFFLLLPDAFVDATVALTGVDFDAAELDADVVVFIEEEAAEDASVPFDDEVVEEDEDDNDDDDEEEDDPFFESFVVFRFFPVFLLPVPVPFFTMAAFLPLPED
jgi:hypothetical protein